MSVTEARNRIYEAVELVKQGKEVELTENGKVVAVWVSPSKLHKEVKKTSNITFSENLQTELEELRKSLPPLPEGSLSLEQAESLIDEVRSNRDITL